MSIKIAIYSTQVIPTTPDLSSYGGLETISGLQAKYFDEVGHEVHLFGCKGSWKPPHGHLYVVGEKGTDPVLAWKSYLSNPAIKQVLTDADMVCSHDWGYLPYSIHNELKHLCQVWHGPDPGFIKPPPVPKPNFITVSFNHAKRLMKLAPGTQWRAVHNGIPTYKYTFNSKPIAERERLLFVSRMYLPKGVHRAIEIANMMKMPIDIVGGSFGDLSNYTEQIKKMCEQSQYGAKFHGEVSFAKKLEFYRNAKCVLLPIIEYGMTDAQGKQWEWHEPFGLVTSEAGACGTPTIVTPNGGWNESMMHGFNGYFANTNEEFCYYLKRINEIKPENCRWAAERFDYKIMGENYLKLFKEIIESGGW